MTEKERISAAAEHAHAADSLMGPRYRAAYDGFLAGASWQKERDGLTPLMAVGAKDMAEVRDALGTFGEGMAAILQGIKSLQEAGLRGADRGVALLKHAQENGDIARRVEALIGEKVGVLLDVLKHLGETTEAVLDEVMPHDVDQATTEPMHADVKAANYYDPGKPSVPLGDVDDDTLRDLATSGQISEARYFEEHSRRLSRRADYPSLRSGIVTWEGKPYMLIGGELHPLRVMP